MTSEPPYIVNTVREEDVTVDWFFGGRYTTTKVKQLILMIVGWLFVVLPVFITASSIVNRNNTGRGWWDYHEGFVMWDVTMICLGILLVLFIVGFMVLLLADRSSAKRRNEGKTYDEQRLGLRLEVATNWYADKFGPEDQRRQQSRVEIQPLVDVETYELRNLYRTHGVD